MSREKARLHGDNTKACPTTDDAAARASKSATPAVGHDENGSIFGSQNKFRNATIINTQTAGHDV